jgi:hypothetical protein
MDTDSVSRLLGVSVEGLSGGPVGVLAEMMDFAAG